MNTIGVSISPFANVVTPFSPVGKQAVGLENADAKQDILPPVEESDSGAQLANEETETEEGNTSRQQPDNEERVEEREAQQQDREEQQIIRELAARDREVRAHEQAHAAVGGQYAGAPSYTYERGPDGVNYAVGGEVSISLPRGGDDPQQNLEAAEQVRRAALAPADPSAQDRRVAAAASNLANQARAEIAAEKREQRAEDAEQQDSAGADEQQGAFPAATDSVSRDQEDREQRLEALRAASRRTNQLTQQLVTQNNIQRDANVGAVFDQLA